MATAPRRVIPGTTSLDTRRCSERRLFMRPCELTNQIFLFVLAVAAERYGILVHAFCVLSNHYHLLLTDPRGRLPDFHQYLDMLLAKALNCSLKRWESFWDPGSYSAVRLETDETVLEKLVYTLANPVAAGLVAHGREWPGLWSDPGLMGGPGIEVKRPTAFFRKKSSLPESVTLKLTPPPGVEDVAAFVELVRPRLAEAEEAAAAELRKAHRSFLGTRAVLKQNPRSRPAPNEPRRELDPQIACRSKWRRIQALQVLVEFRRAYREALTAWRAGVRDVVFPAGTWRMRVWHGATCASFG